MSTSINNVAASIIRNRSQSFSEVDNLDNLNKSLPRPPQRRDFGVMCGVLTRNVGVGHQYPHTKTVSTLTVNCDDTPSRTYSDKWYSEKIKFLTNQNDNLTKNNSIMVTQTTQTIETRKVTTECGTQTLLIKPEVPKRNNNYTQTYDIKKHVLHVGCNVKPNSSDVVTQTSVDTKSIGISIEVPCEKCSIPKASVGVGSDNSVDAHISPVSLANLAMPRSKSFNLGEDKLNLSARNRTVGCQYETTANSVACQYVMKTHSKACQNDVKTSHKSSQHEYTSVSRVTDTRDLGPDKVNVACEAKEATKEKVDFACYANSVPDTWSCVKCAGKEKEKEEILKKEGSPTPSRIPRPQIPTTPVENRKFRRQDTYTKIPASPTDKALSSPTR